MIKEKVIQLIKRFDRNIHPNRIDDVFNYIHTISISLSLLAGSILIGVIGFVIIEGYNLLDAFYMTIITISTVGYGELYPLSNAGRLFVSFLIITNIGVFAYAATNLANFIVSGNFQRIFGDLFVGRKIDHMKNHIIVCGFGRYGKSVIENLLNQQLDVVLIENDQEKVNEIRKDKNIIVLDGDATDEYTLIEAGVDHAQALITTLPVDADNVYTILTARQINPQIKIISRANLASSKSKMMRAGANEVLVPENIGGFYMSALVTKPDIINVFTEISGFEGRNFRMAETIIEPLPDRLKGRTIGDLALESHAGVKIIGMKSPDGHFLVNPPNKTPLEEGMGILVIGNEHQIGTFHTLTEEFEFIE